VIVVFACCRRWRNNLNEPLDPFPFGVDYAECGGTYIFNSEYCGEKSNRHQILYKKSNLEKQAQSSHH